MRARLVEWDGRWTERLSVAEKPGPLRAAAVVLAHSGDSWFWLLGLAAVFFLGRPEARPVVLGLAAAIVVTAGTVLGLKLLVRRRRPEGTWGSIYRRTDPHSFPSGHAARAVLLAVLFAGWVPGWPAAVLLVWAPLVALSRVAMGVHFLVDALAGAVLGLAAGLIFLAILPF
jgi:membrane-associated phospholipid phosphatase